MKEKTKQRMNDIKECFNWDSEASALTEAWDRGYDFLQKENNVFVKEILEEIGELSSKRLYRSKSCQLFSRRIKQIIKQKAGEDSI